MRNKRTAFTLVELIVVIVILAILGTIAFFSFQGYSSWARDTSRVADMTTIVKSLDLYILKQGELIKPDGAIEITASGVLIGYQGYAGEKVLGSIGIFNGGKDPLDGSYYTYYISENKRKYQLLGFLEKERELGYRNELSKTYAELENKYIYTKGNQLGILLDEITNEPIQNKGNPVDIVTTSTGYKVKLNNFTNGEVSGTGKVLSVELKHRINERGSCDAILKNGRSEGNKLYTIYPQKGGPGFKIYCDMSIPGEGWTALFSVHSSSKTWSYTSTEWTSPVLRGNDFLNEETTYDSYSQLETRKIKICRINNSQCYTLNHNKNIPLKKFYTDNITYLDFSRFNYRDDLSPTHSYNINTPDNIGEDNTDKYFSSLGITNTYNSFARNKYGLGINIRSNNKLGFQGDNNNSWPSVDNVVVGIGAFSNWQLQPNGCSGSRPISSIKAKSIITQISNICHYDVMVSEMWYVYGM